LEKTMRKIIVMLLAAGCFVAFSGNAQTSGSTAGTTGTTPGTSSSSSSTKMSQDDLIKVRTSELPAMVTQTLGNSEYSGWTISSAYRTKTNDQYLVEVKKGTQTKTYWFDKNGNRTEGVKGSGTDTGTGETGTRVDDGTGKSGTGTSGSGTTGTGGTGTGDGTGSGTTDR
jgi:hypothetical protein